MSNSRVVLFFADDDGLYSYGDASNAQLGYQTSARFTTKPQRIAFPPGCTVRQAAAGKRHCVAVDALGYVFVWGQNDKSQCGVLGDGSSAAIREPCLLQNLPLMRACCAGTDFTLLLSVDGDV